MMKKELIASERLFQSMITHGPLLKFGDGQQSLGLLVSVIHIDRKLPTLTSPHSHCPKTTAHYWHYYC